MAKSKKNKPHKHRSARKQIDKKQLWISLGLAAFVFLLYANTLSHGFVLDDDLVTRQNIFVQKGLSGLGDIFSHSFLEGYTQQKDAYYRPLTLTSFALEQSLFGGSSGGFHFMHVLYYALGVVFLYRVLLLLFGKENYLLPLAATLLYLAHPIHTEVVANIKSRDELLTFLGMLAVVYGLMKYYKTREKGYFALSLSAYFLSLLCKEGAFAFLGIVPLTLYFFTDTSLRKTGIQTLAFGGVAVLAFVLRLPFTDASVSEFTVTDNALFAASGPGEQLATAIYMVGKYFTLLLFPHPLSWDYSYNQIPITGWADWRVWLSLLTCLALIGVTVWGIKKKHIVSFSILLFGITFVITSNIFFLTGATFAERFMFIPSLGFCLILAYLGVNFLLKNTSTTVFYSCMALILGLYAFKTISRNVVWESDAILFASGLETAPNSIRTNCFYGDSRHVLARQTKNQQQKQQYVEEAISYFEKSVEILPEYVEGFHHLGNAYLTIEDHARAVEIFEEGLKVKSDYHPILQNAGVAYFNMNNMPKAIEYYERSLQAFPDHVSSMRNLALAKERIKEYEQATDLLKKALELQPENISLLQDLVRIYRTQNQIDTAIFYDKKIKAIRHKQ